MNEIIERSRHLLKDGETIEALDLGGWVILSNLLKPGDEVIICWDSHTTPVEFKAPFRATINKISSNNLMSLTAQTNVIDRYGERPPGPLSGWRDLMRCTYKIVQKRPSLTP